MQPRSGWRRSPGSRRRSGGRGPDRGQRYRLVSELRRPGEQFAIPDRAENVSVDVLSPQVVRVTYLSPLTRLGFEDSETEERDPYYID